MAKTFLGKIIASILEVFKSNFPEFIKKIYNKIPDDLKFKLSAIVQVVENIKTFVDSPTADLITEIIPGDLDDDLKDWLRKVLPAILEKYKDISGAGYYHLVATELTSDLTGASFGQSAITIEAVYQNS